MVYSKKEYGNIEISEDYRRTYPSQTYINRCDPKYLFSCLRLYTPLFMLGTVPPRIILSSASPSLPKVRDTRESEADASPSNTDNRQFIATSGANLYSPGVWFADVMTSFSGVTFVLLCFALLRFSSLRFR